MQLKDLDLKSFINKLELEENYDELLDTERVTEVLRYVQNLNEQYQLQHPETRSFSLYTVLSEDCMFDDDVIQYFAEEYKKINQNQVTYFGIPTTKDDLDWNEVDLFGEFPIEVVSTYAVNTKQVTPKDIVKEVLGIMANRLNNSSELSEYYEDQNEHHQTR